jgi:hypothetical protein
LAAASHQAPPSPLYVIDVAADGAPVVSIANTLFTAEFKRVDDQWYVFHREIAEKLAN